MSAEVIQTLLALYLSWTGLCRIRKTDINTQPAVRHAFSALFAIMLAVAVAPWVWTIPPVVLNCLMGASFAIVQLCTGKYWIRSVPETYQRNQGRRLRRHDDAMPPPMFSRWPFISTRFSP